MMYQYAVLLICAVVSAEHCADKDRKENHEEFVGFSASVDQIKTFTPGETVKFSRVITNAGNNYDPDTGVFTAPRAGYYLFQIHALTNGATAFWFQLVQNEIPRVNAHAYNPWSMGGNSVLLKVAAADRLYVKAVVKPASVYHETSHNYVTFTGYLVGQ
ncbi:hypothetical protein BsWGS_25969 [Bradybaena similaris]